MAPWLRALAALTEDPSTDLSNHNRWFTASFMSSSSISNDSVLCRQTERQTDTHREKQNIFKMLKRKSKTQRHI